SPTICVLLGQGGGGTALALVPADRVLAAQHAWLAPLPPEASAEVLYRTVDRAPRPPVCSASPPPTCSAPAPSTGSSPSVPTRRTSPAPSCSASARHSSR